MDRNIQPKDTSKKKKVALRKESVDRNLILFITIIILVKSLSARRAWIETRMVTLIPRYSGSLSARRAWIETHISIA